MLATRCLEEADCAAAFAARLAQVADVFEEMDLAAEAERIHALILPNVAADPRREFDLPTWTGSISSCSRGSRAPGDRARHPGGHGY